MNSKDKRLFWESKIIATIGQAKLKPSSNWLGNFSPKVKIRESGLWQVQGLQKPIMTGYEFKQLVQIINNVN